MTKELPIISFIIHNIQEPEGDKMKTIMEEKIAMDGYVRDRWPDSPVVSTRITLRLSMELFDKMTKESNKKKLPLPGLLSELIIQHYK